MSTRPLILKITASLATLIAGGCMSPIETEEIEDRGEDVVVDPTGETPTGSSSVNVAISQSQFDEVARWFGKTNAITFESPIHVERDGTTLDAKGGTRIDYEVGDGIGRFVFSKPYPTVKTNLISRMIGGVSLREITLNADGSGAAMTGLGRVRIQWLEGDEDAGTAAVANELPEVWAYSQPGCPPCVRARLELAAAKDLPFKVVWKDEASPEWLQSRPAFWWHVSADQPSQKDVNNTRQLTGWNGIKDFTERWKNSRQPKRFQRTKTLAHNASHDCPNCGREQYVIENQNGPVANSHSHRCGTCGTAWWHADAN